MLSFPNCKINIGLNIINKRDDGFHNIETVFYPVNWCDILEINKRTDLKNDNYKYTDGISINLSGNEINGSIESNLCYKAFQFLKTDFNLPDVVLHLHKIIPTGAGLGGGSGNGAATLQLLNRTFQLGLTQVQLKNYADQLGSDCTFFIDNKPSFATGRGELTQEIELQLNGIHITIIKPAVHITTAAAYLSVKPGRPQVSLKTLIFQPIASWKEHVINDFEESIFKLHPGLLKIKNELYSSCCVFACMSGSGSSIYGLSYNAIEIENKFNDCIKWQGIL